MSCRASAGQPLYAESDTESELDEASNDQKVISSPKKSKYFAHSDSSRSKPESPDFHDSFSEESDDSAEEETTDDLDEAITNGPNSTRRLGAGSKASKMKAKPQTSSNIIAARKPQGQDVAISTKRRKISDEKDEFTGEYFVAKLAALPEGKVAYRPETIHPNSLAFLQEIRTNNERDWFQARDLQYQATKKDFDSFVISLANTIRTIDDTIPELPVKDLTFRIYRDIRFSNDRTPYKTFLSAYFSRSGRKGPWAGYYFSLEPGGKTLLACGLWQPPPADLALVREGIDVDAEVWISLLEDPGFVQFFGGKQGLLKTEDKLKTCPKGYNKDHERIELLRLKSFTVSLNFSDDEVLKDEFLEIASVVIAQMYPFVTLLNGIIRPDNPDEFSDSDTSHN